MQEGKAEALHHPVPDRSCSARDQSGLLHRAKHLPSVQPNPVHLRRGFLVWLDSLDMLEHSKLHEPTPTASLPAALKLMTCCTQARACKAPRVLLKVLCTHLEGVPCHVQFR